MTYQNTYEVDERINDLEYDVEDEIGEEAYTDFINLDEDEFREKYGDDVNVNDLEELAALHDFRDELQGYCDWRGGETLIHESRRVEYVEEFARDIGAIGETADWIMIDWETTAIEFFRYDYTYADLQGDTYYVRLR